MFYQTLFIGTPGDTYKALETGLSLSPQGPHWGTWRVAPLPGTLKGRWRALEMERTSLWGLYKGHLEGGSFTGNPEGYVKEDSGNRPLSP
jgi:hypothetical protein